MGQNAIELLKEDHEKVKKLLDELNATSSRAEKKRAQLLEKIALELHVHTEIEERIFYPAFKEAGKKPEGEMYHEAKEEHRAVEDLVLPDLEETPVGSEEFAGRAKVLKDMIEHHVHEEEEEMFPKAMKLMDEDELVELGARMMELKQELMSSMSTH